MFYILFFMFRPVINLELILWTVWNRCSESFFSQMGINLLSIMCGIIHNNWVHYIILKWRFCCIQEMKSVWICFCMLQLILLVNISILLQIALCFNNDSFVGCLVALLVECPTPLIWAQVIISWLKSLNLHIRLLTDSTEPTWDSLLLPDAQESTLNK